MARVSDLMWALRTCEQDCRIIVESGVLYKVAPIGRRLVADYESGYWLEKVIGGYIRCMPMKAG